MQRARSDSARAFRLGVILDGAASCFDVMGVDVTLDQIATASGLTRTTLYGYGSTKEEVLLLLLDREVSEWFSAVIPGIRRVRSVNGVVRVLGDTIAERPRFCALLSLCGPILERNVSLDAATIWKRRLHDQLLQAGAAIDVATNAPTGSGARFLLHVSAATTGLYGIATPPPVAAKAIAVADLRSLTIDFALELRIALDALATRLLPSR